MKTVSSMYRLTLYPALFMNRMQGKINEKGLSLEKGVWCES